MHLLYRNNKMMNLLGTQQRCGAMHLSASVTFHYHGSHAWQLGMHLRWGICTMETETFVFLVGGGQWDLRTFACLT